MSGLNQQFTKLSALQRPASSNLALSAKESFIEISLLFAIPRLMSKLTFK